ncbi:MAG: hypothetical protein ACOYVD_02335 [Bacillota bacterium]
MNHEKHIKFGGMKFEQNADNKEINKFVRDLPKEKKQSMYQVVNELDDANLIDMKNEVTTIDDETIHWQETKIGDE